MILNEGCSEIQNVSYRYSDKKKQYFLKTA